MESVRLLACHEFKNPTSGLDFHVWKQNSAYPHTHDYYEIFFITQGSIVHTRNGAASVLDKKTLFFIYPEDCHSFSPYNNAKSQHINISLTPAMLDSLSGSLGADILHRIHEHSLADHTVLDNALFAALEAAAHRYLLSSSENTRTLILKGIIIDALIELYRLSHDTLRYPDWFRVLLEQISDEAFMSKKVCDIYALSHYSQPQLLHYFRLYLGESIVSYFTRIKLNYACSLLSDTNFTVLHIAGLLAYDSLSHFIRIFKKHTGQTPSEYRKTH